MPRNGLFSQAGARKLDPTAGNDGLRPLHAQVYEAAIAANYAPMSGQSIGKHDLVVKFHRGARSLNPSRPCTVPSWDHSTGLRALRGPAFEPLKMTDLQSLLLKTALLLALVPVKRDGDLQALSLEPSSLDFSPNDSKVVLMPRKG